jgi:hypothetical protein
MFLATILCGVASLAGCDFSKLYPEPQPAAAPQPVAAAPTQPAPDVPMERVEAQPGVAKRGQKLQGEDVNRVIAQPVRSLFAVEQRLIYDSVVYAVKLYKAEHGNAPKTHEEFMEKIIKANNIKLPELPEGHRYIWVPEEEQLYVERPAESPSSSTSSN